MIFEAGGGLDPLHVAPIVAEPGFQGAPVIDAVHGPGLFNPQMVLVFVQLLFKPDPCAGEDML